MLAKVIGYGPTRDDARRTLAGALSRARLHGVVTNRDLLVGILREPEFTAGAIDTGYLDRHRPAELCPAGAEAGPVHLLAVALAGQASAARGGPGAGHAALGLAQQPERPAAGTATSWTAQPVEVTYRLGRDGPRAEVDGTDRGRRGAARHPAPAPAPPGLVRMLVDLEVGGVRRVIDVTQAGGTFYVDSVLGHSVLTEADRFPDPAAAAQAGSLLAPMPGTVVRVEVAVGDHVEAGAVILAIEAMKMEHAIRAPVPGIVTELPVSVGTQVDSGSVLAVLEPWWKARGGRARGGRARGGRARGGRGSR